jgi:thiosulfate dehydrogenase
MIKFFGGVLSGICLVLLAGYLIITGGAFPMSTSAGPLPLERLLAHKAISAAIGKAGDEKSPLPADEANLLAGARIYQENGCQGCHGKLDGPPSKMAKRFYPHAPALMPPSHGVTDDPVGETHWVVKNGIRFSAMPSFGEKLSDEEIWQVSLLLQQADKLPAPVRETLGK